MIGIYDCRDTPHRLNMPADNRDVAVKRLQHVDNRLGNTTPTEDGYLAANDGSASIFGPLLFAGVSVRVTHSAKQQSNG
jgi:hypothetical protein